MKKYVFCFAIFLLTGCFGNNPVNNGPTNTPTPHPQQPTKSLHKYVFELPLGRYADYSVDPRTGNGYLLVLQNRRVLKLSVFDPTVDSGGQFSEFEVVTGQGPGHNLMFNSPRVVTTKTKVFVVWGDQSKKDNGLYVMSRGLSGGAWSPTKKLFANKWFEWFDVESDGETVFIVGLHLVDIGTPERAARVLLADTSGAVYSEGLRDSNGKFIVTKDLNAEFSESGPLFTGKFQSMYLVQLKGTSPTIWNFGSDVYGLPIPFHLTDGTLVVHGFGDWKNQGHTWWPTTLKMQSQSGQKKTLQTFSDVDGQNTSVHSVSVCAGEFFGVAYDMYGLVRFSDFSGEKEVIGTGTSVVGSRFGCERTEVVALDPENENKGYVYSFQWK